MLARGTPESLAVAAFVIAIGDSRNRFLRSSSGRRAMDDPDRLAFYPFVVDRIACRVCTPNGAYRLARLAAIFGPEINLCLAREIIKIKARLDAAHVQ